MSFSCRSGALVRQGASSPGPGRPSSWRVRVRTLTPSGPATLEVKPWAAPMILRRRRVRRRVAAGLPRRGDGQLSRYLWAQVLARRGVNRRGAQRRLTTPPVYVFVLFCSWLLLITAYAERAGRLPDRSTGRAVSSCSSGTGSGPSDGAVITFDVEGTTACAMVEPSRPAGQPCPGSTVPGPFPLFIDSSLLCARLPSSLFFSRHPAVVEIRAVQGKNG